MKLLVSALTLSLVVTTAALGADKTSNGSAHVTKPQVRTVDGSQPMSDLPTISQFQTPGIVPNVGPCGPSGCQQDDGWTQDDCNCYRTCNTPTCYLGPSTDGCKVVTGSPCTDCSVPKCTT